MKALQTGFTQDQAATVLQFYSDAVHTWKSTPKDVAGCSGPAGSGVP
jgi:hypothetical protein